MKERGFGLDPVVVGRGKQMQRNLPRYNGNDHLNRAWSRTAEDFAVPSQKIPFTSLLIGFTQFIHMIFASYLFLNTLIILNIHYHYTSLNIIYYPLLKLILH